MDRNEVLRRMNSVRVWYADFGIVNELIRYNKIR